jgi:hypothetical protein
VDLAFPDANGDRLPDICLGLEQGDVVVFLGLGDGSFPLAQAFFAGQDIEAVRTADLDGDGIDEILVSNGVPGLSILSFTGDRSQP